MADQTPEEARQTIEYAEELRPDFHKSWRALETIAGMREEWGAERQVRGRWVRIVFALNTIWTDDRAIAESAVDDCRDLGLPARLVRRYVTTEEEA